MLVGSWLLIDTRGAEWPSDALLNVGAAVVLFAPLLLLTEWLLEQRVLSIEDDVQQTREDVRQTQKEVGDAQAQLSTLIDYTSEEGRKDAAAQLDQDVRDQMFSEQRDLLDLFASLATQASVEPFVRGVRLAMDKEFVTHEGPRVPLLYSELHLRFLPHGAGIELRIESNDGEVLATVPWRDSMTVTDALAQVSVLARDLPGFDGMDKFFAGQTPRQLGEMLMFAARHGAEMTGDYAIHRVVEITEDGWIITERGMVPRSVLHYVIRFDSAAPIDWEEHILNKEWEESHSFPYVYRWARELNDRRKLAEADSPTFSH
jgi:hypothetical protein